MNQELMDLFSGNSKYKSAYDQFLEEHNNNRGKGCTKEQLEFFEKCFARNFLRGIKNDSKEREVLVSGERIYLRKANLSDVDFMQSVEADSENSHWVGNWPLGYRISVFGDDDFLQIIIEKTDGTPIGLMIFCDMLYRKTKLQLKRIVITEKGKGYGKEALLLAQKLAFEVYKTKYLSLGTKPDNLRAQVVYKATGFMPETPDSRTKFCMTDKQYKQLKQEMKTFT